MARTVPFYSVDPTEPDVYHECDNCPNGRRIPARHRRPGGLLGISGKIEDVLSLKLGEATEPPLVTQPKASRQGGSVVRVPAAKEKTGMRDDLSSRVAIARMYGPQDWFTRSALFANDVFTIICFVLIPIQIVTTAASGCLFVLTAGLMILPLMLIWLVFSRLLLGTSILWIKVPISRPLLILPGLLVAFLAHLFVQLVSNPDGPSDRAVKMLLCDAWPLTWLVLRPPVEWQENRVD